MGGGAVVLVVGVTGAWWLLLLGGRAGGLDRRRDPCVRRRLWRVRPRVAGQSWVFAPTDQRTPADAGDH